MTPTVIFTPSQLIRPARTTSLDILDLKALIDDHIRTWSNLLCSESPPVSDNNSPPIPPIWSSDRNRNKYDVPLLKPAVPKSYNPSLSDARVLFSFVEKTLKEDALEDWQPFIRDDASRASTVTTITKASSDADSEKAPPSSTPLPKFLTTTPISISSAVSRLSDEGARLSTPLDWKPFHPSDPLFNSSHEDGDSPKAYSFALDDCLISQGDAAKARRKRRKQFLDIPEELIARRDTAQVIHLLKNRGVRRPRGEFEGLDLATPF